MENETYSELLVNPYSLLESGKYPTKESFFRDVSMEALKVADDLLLYAISHNTTDNNAVEILEIKTNEFYTRIMELSEIAWELHIKSKKRRHQMVNVNAIFMFLTITAITVCISNIARTDNKFAIIGFTCMAIINVFTLYKLIHLTFNIVAKK